MCTIETHYTHFNQRLDHLLLLYRLHQFLESSVSYVKENVEKLPLHWKIFNLHKKSNHYTTTREKNNTAEFGNKARGVLNTYTDQEKGEDQDKVTSG